MGMCLQAVGWYC